MTRAAFLDAPGDLGRARLLEVEAGDTVATLLARSAVSVGEMTLARVGADWLTPGEEWLTAEEWGTFALDRVETLVLVSVPAGGDGGKNILRSVAMIAVAVAAFALGPAVAGVVGLSGQVATSVASAVLFAAGSFIVNAVLPPPVASGDFADVPTGSPTYSLAAQGNQARLGEVIPRLYGRHLYFPDFAAAPYTEFSGNEQYLNTVFVLSVGDVEIEEVRIGDTAVWLAGSGLTGNFDDVEIEFADPFEEITLFPVDVNVAAEVSGQELLGTNEGGHDWIGPFPANAPGTQINAIAVDVVFPAGLGKIDNDGDLVAKAIGILIEAREIDDVGVATGAWFTVEAKSWTLATLTAQRYSLRNSVSPARYEVRVKRTNAKDFDAAAANEARWSALRGYVTGETVPANVTRLALRVRATNQLSSTSARRIGVLATGKVPIYDGAAWSAPAVTRAPVWAALDILRNTDYGAGLALAHETLEVWRALDATLSARADTYNRVIDKKTTVWDAVAGVLRGARAQPILLADQVSVVRDGAQTLPRGVITPRDMVRGSFSLDYLLPTADAPDAAIVEYWDDTTWNRAEVRAELPGATGANPATIRLEGVTDRAQAWREGMYHLAAGRYRRTLATLAMEWDGRLYARGDQVLVAHDVPQWAQSGEVVAEAAGTLTLDRVVALTGDDVLMLRTHRGRAWGPVAVTAAGTADEIVIDPDDRAAVEAVQEPLATILRTDAAGERTRFALGPAADGPAKPMLVVGMTPRGTDRVELALVNDASEVHTADAGAPPALVTTPLTAADGPVVDSVALRLVGIGSPYVTLEASWPPAAGADEYVLQISRDGWASADTLAVSPATQATFTVEPGDVAVRVAAIGAVRGPWVYTSGTFDAAAILAAPMGISIGEELYATTGSAGVKVRALIDWQAVAGVGISYEARWRRAGAPLWAPLGTFSEPRVTIDDVAPGAIEIEVRAISAAGAASAWTRATATIVGLTAPPASPTGLTMTGVGGMAILRWDRAADLDVRIGGTIEIRHTPLLVDPSWANAVSVGPPVNGDETFAVVPLRPGTYFIRARDSSGLYSPTSALVTTKGAVLQPFGNLATITEHPTFSGAKTDVTVSDSKLQLTAAGRAAGVGLYEFAAGFDFGAIVKRRVMVTAAVLIENLTDTIGSRGLVSTWPSVTAAEDAPADVIVEFAETDDDPGAAPVWSVWNRLDVTEVEARGLKFRARLLTETPDFNPLVSGLTITAEEYQ